MIFEKLREIIAEQFATDPEEITMETSFVDDLCADSLDIVELTMAMEEEFDLPELSDEELKSLVTVGDVVDFISSKSEQE